ncbi:hypothetical protein [Palleronia caenipelagi]|uniref:hypothetical protein n=1 Tax=Palleronia caenipelagi TaxID=2489174 RepID=UPI001FEA034D|nr:hypothetical protein [Palleronia caenipelagi]
MDDDPREEEEGLWLLPPPLNSEPDFLPLGPGAAQSEGDLVGDWTAAEAGHTARMARRLGALDERLRRGPGGRRAAGAVDGVAAGESRR